jgi:hypothetical protein
MKKKFFAILMVMCLVCTSGLGLITSSAASDTPPASVSFEASGLFEPFASDDISRIAYSVTSSRYSADIFLRANRSGSVYMELQRRNGNNWNFVDSTSWTFSNVRDTFGSKNFNITQSGTYRIHLVITINNVSTERQSGNFTI